ncbi:hypothetical protein VNO77_34697 [Canavalia gladiata]|uniref:Uncharacterized protein n=1 Tax=Canavalia gladiata TaxID=3824 RepID=A0AAN9KDY8_CANGL
MVAYSFLLVLTLVGYFLVCYVLLCDMVPTKEDVTLPPSLLQDPDLLLEQPQQHFLGINLWKFLMQVNGYMKLHTRNLKTSEKDLMLKYSLSTSLAKK